MDSTQTLEHSLLRRRMRVSWLGAIIMSVISFVVTGIFVVLVFGLFHFNHSLYDDSTWWQYLLFYDDTIVSKISWALFIALPVSSWLTCSYLWDDALNARNVLRNV